jgi:uncharacterized protein (DUF4415 family)
MSANLADFLTLATPAAPRRRARPPKRKTRITIYLDDEVLDEFRRAPSAPAPATRP